eukprot:SAG22_NODE_21199_length_259_cov_0.643750_1_plen_25_part_01
MWHLWAALARLKLAAASWPGQTTPV